MNWGVAFTPRLRHSESTSLPMESQRVDLRRWRGLILGVGVGDGDGDGEECFSERRDCDMFVREWGDGQAVSKYQL